jgi:hypothetical protein
MTEQETKDVRAGFAQVADAFAQSTLPEDDGVWDNLVPSDAGDFTVTDILCHFEASPEVMPDLMARTLGLPVGSTYGEGAERIWDDLSRRAKVPRLVSMPADRSRTETTDADAEEIAWLQQLAQIENEPQPQPTRQKSNWQEGGF